MLGQIREQKNLVGMLWSMSCAAAVHLSINNISSDGCFQSLEMWDWKYKRITTFRERREYARTK